MAAVTGVGGGTRSTGLRAHLVWEAVLVVLLAVAVWALAGTGASSRNVTSTAGVVGLAAVAVALSVRLRAPNLAVGPVAQVAATSTSGLINQGGWSPWAAMGAVVLGVAVVGAVAGLVAGALRLPVWAVSIGVGVLATAVVVSRQLSGFEAVRLPLPDRLPVGLFVVVALLLGVLGRTGGTRAPASASFGAGAGIARAVPALAGSNVLAALAGLALLDRNGIAVTGFDLLWPGLAAVALGGAVLGRGRLGPFGTLLGALLIAVTDVVVLTRSVARWGELAVWGAAILVGLVAGRVIGGSGQPEGALSPVAPGAVAFPPGLPAPGAPSIWAPTGGGPFAPSPAAWSPPAPVPATPGAAPSGPPESDVTTPLPSPPPPGLHPS